MAPPNYFFPGVSAGQLVRGDRLNPEVLAPRKLDVTFADVTSVERQCTAVDLAGPGPGGQCGCILCAHRTDGGKPPGVGMFKPNRQEWEEIVEAGGRYWLGLDRDLRPGPDDLVRAGPNPFDHGYWVELAGAQWYIPVIRDVDGGSGLPKDWQLQADDTLRTTIDAIYRDLWSEFAAVVDLVFDPAEGQSADRFALDPAEMMRRCLQGVSLRYRIGRALLNRLGLINSRTAFSVLGAMIDLQTFWEVFVARLSEAKKNGSPGPDPAPPAASPPTPPGEPGSDPITDQAGESLSL